MKPKEFDELIKQQFDRNDFAYNPKNWDQLAERLDGNAKKRRIMMWWWAPVVGMAASVALAFGVSTMLRMGAPAGTGAGLAQAHKEQNGTNRQHDAQLAAVPYTPGQVQNAAGTPNEKSAHDNSNNNTNYVAPAAKTQAKQRHAAEARNRTALNKRTHGAGADMEDGFSINLSNATGSTVVLNAKPSTLNKKKANDEEVKKNKVAILDPIGTFMPEEQQQPKKLRRVSVILSGGYNRGSQNTGYMAGATIRKMINSRVYVESDVAFASSNNTQTTAYSETQSMASGLTNNPGVTARTSKDMAKPAVLASTTEVIKQKDISYDLYYAQVTPSIGYNVMKRMSIAVGPDFQRMLVDNRPTPSSVDRGTIQVAPIFDVGFIGKTEVGVTKKLKAAVYYRKGVNNVITPMGKFIDRDYLQFQLKYTILNK